MAVGYTIVVGHLSVGRTFVAGCLAAGCAVSDGADCSCLFAAVSSSLTFQLVPGVVLILPL